MTSKTCSWCDEPATSKQTLDDPKGQMFGTDGHVTWTEPQLFDLIGQLDAVLDKARKVAPFITPTTEPTDDTEAMF